MTPQGGPGRAGQTGNTLRPTHAQPGHAHVPATDTPAPGAAGKPPARRAQPREAPGKREGDAGSQGTWSASGDHIRGQSGSPCGQSCLGQSCPSHGAGNAGEAVTGALGAQAPHSQQRRDPSVGSPGPCPSSRELPHLQGRHLAGPGSKAPTPQPAPQVKHEANATARACPGPVPDAPPTLRFEDRGAQWTGPWEVPEAPPVTAALTPPSWGPSLGLRVPKPTGLRTSAAETTPSYNVLVKTRATETLSDICSTLGHVISPTTPTPPQHGPPGPERPLGIRL